MVIYGVQRHVCDVGMIGGNLPVRVALVEILDPGRRPVKTKECSQKPKIVMLNSNIHTNMENTVCL